MLDDLEQVFVLHPRWGLGYVVGLELRVEGLVFKFEGLGLGV